MKIKNSIITDLGNIASHLNIRGFIGAMWCRTRRFKNRRFNMVDVSVAGMFHKAVLAFDNDYTSLLMPVGEEHIRTSIRCALYRSVSS